MLKTNDLRLIAEKASEWILSTEKNPFDCELECAEIGINFHKKTEIGCSVAITNPNLDFVGFRIEKCEKAGYTLQEIVFFELVKNLALYRVMFYDSDYKFLIDFER